MIEQEAYQKGYKEGVMIGRLEVQLDFVKLFMKKYKLKSYEECFGMLSYDEYTIARLMDYLPVHREKWQTTNRGEFKQVIERIGRQVRKKGERINKRIDKRKAGENE